MYVVTADQRASRSDIDRVPDLQRRFAGLPVVRSFERTAGDEVEAVLDDPVALVAVAAELAASGYWTVGVGIGAVESPLPAETRAGRGPAFEAARFAVEAAKGRRLPVRVAGPSPWCVHAQTALWQLVDLSTGRTAAGRETVALMATGLTQSQAAERLGITPQAVSLRLRAARWDLQAPSEALAVALLAASDRGDRPVPADWAPAERAPAEPGPVEWAPGNGSER